jgi:hypothetical protein
MHRRWSIRVRLLARICILVGVIADCGNTAVAQQGATDSTPDAPLQEVTVTAARVLDHRTLVHAVSGFVKSHSAPGARINQVGRWHLNVCPQVTGLQPACNDFVVREVLDVARDVGAPVQAARK